MTTKAWVKFIKKNHSYFEKAFSGSAKDRTSKESMSARSRLIAEVRKEFGYHDRDDAFVVNKLFGRWQYYAGVNH